MLPDPLHPAVVHLPIALAVLTPLLALLTLFARRHGFLPARAWTGIVLLQALLAGSAWLALETGEDQEERVEKFVAERHIEEHEEAAERMLAVSVAVLLFSAAGLLTGRLGTVGHVATIAGGAAAFAAAIATGHSGGELVYRHGAASAYVQSAASPPDVAAPPRAGE
jgi:uncharacterized membrane protein